MRWQQARSGERSLFKVHEPQGKFGQGIKNQILKVRSGAVGNSEVKATSIIKINVMPTQASKQASKSHHKPIGGITDMNIRISPPTRQQ